MEGYVSIKFLSLTFIGFCLSELLLSLMVLSKSYQIASVNCR